MHPPVSNEILKVPDDAWEIVRDCRVFFLKQLVRLLQEAERLPEDPLRAFVKGAGAYYDDIVSTEKRSRFDQLGSLTASRISLLGDDDLELDIRLSSFVSQLLKTRRSCSCKRFTGSCRRRAATAPAGAAAVNRAGCSRSARRA